MNVYQAAKQIDCTELMDKERVSGRWTTNGRGKWVCPFHDDHDPSMVTYPGEPGRPSHFYCFTCGAHGDAVDLYAKMHSLKALEAAKRLCKQWGLTYDERTPNGAGDNRNGAKNDDPRLGVVLAICGEWQTYRVKWYEEQLRLCRERLNGPIDADWALEMERQWEGFYVEQLRRYRAMTEWEVLLDIRAEFEALGINPYRRLRIAGVAH